MVDRLATAALVLLLGCSSLPRTGWDGVVSVETRAPDDPEAGPRVWLGTPIDARVFRAATYDMREPSLYRGLDDTPAVRSRAVGRRLRTRGGNLLLPEGDAVQTLVEAVLVRAFRESGYRVGGGEGGAGTRVDSDILRLWTWGEPLPNGLWRFEARVTLRVTGDVAPFAGGGIVCGKHVVSSAGTSPATWSRTLAGALDALAADVRLRLASPARTVPDWHCHP